MLNDKEFQRSSNPDIYTMTGPQELNDRLLSLVNSPAQTEKIQTLVAKFKQDPKTPADWQRLGLVAHFLTLATPSLSDQQLSDLNKFKEKAIDASKNKRDVIGGDLGFLGAAVQDINNRAVDFFKQPFSVTDYAEPKEFSHPLANTIMYFELKRIAKLKTEEFGKNQKPQNVVEPYVYAINGKTTQGLWMSTDGTRFEQGRLEQMKKGTATPTTSFGLFDRLRRSLVG